MSYNKEEDQPNSDESLGCRIYIGILVLILSALIGGIIVAAGDLGTTGWTIVGIVSFVWLLFAVREPILFNESGEYFVFFFIPMSYIIAFAITYLIIYLIP